MEYKIKYNKTMEKEINIAELIKNTRVSLKLSQQELARRCDIRQIDLVRIEHNTSKPSAEVLKALYKELNITNKV